LLFGIEFDELLQEDDEEGRTDHAHDADGHTGQPAQVRPRVEISIAHGSHGDKAHPEGVQEVAEILRLVISRREGRLA
jgi:hypothetical protein